MLLQWESKSPKKAWGPTWTVSHCLAHLKPLSMLSPRPEPPLHTHTQCILIFEVSLQMPFPQRGFCQTHGLGPPSSFTLGSHLGFFLHSVWPSLWLCMNLYYQFADPHWALSPTNLGTAVLLTITFTLPVQCLSDSRFVINISWVNKWMNDWQMQWI